jgi:ribosome-binding protein aMBF1 (putative translation factor)
MVEFADYGVIASCAMLFDKEIMKAMKYHDIPPSKEFPCGQDGLALAFLKMSFLAKVVQKPQFIARVEELRIGQEADKIELQKLQSSEELQRSTKAEQLIKKQSLAEGCGTPVKTNVRFGQRLQSARALKNWKQIDLAQKMGVKLKIVQDWENQKGVLPTATQLRNLNCCLNIDLSKDDKPPPYSEF